MEDKRRRINDSPQGPQQNARYKHDICRGETHRARATQCITLRPRLGERVARTASPHPSTDVLRGTASVTLWRRSRPHCCDQTHTTLARAVRCMHGGKCGRAINSPASRIQVLDELLDLPCHPKCPTGAASATSQDTHRSMNRGLDQRAALTLLDRGGAGGLVISVSHAHVDKAKMGQQYSQNITENMLFFFLDYTGTAFPG